MPGALQIWSLDRLPPGVREDITRKIDELGRRLDTWPHARLSGRSEFKLRVGDYRVLYEFDLTAGRLHLLFVGNRREIYKSNA